MNRIFYKHTIKDWILFTTFFLSLVFWLKPWYLFYYPGFLRNLSISTYSSWFVYDIPYYPGKITDIIISFFIPFLTNKYLNPITLLLITFILVFLAGKIINHFNISNIKALKFLPMILVILMLSFVLNPIYLAISICFSLLFSLIYFVFQNTLSIIRLSVFAILFTILYFISPNAVIIFSFLSILYEVIINKKYAISISEFILAFLIIFIFSFFFSASLKEVSSYLFPPLFQKKFLAQFLFFVFWIFPVIILILEFIYKIINSIFKLRLNKTIIFFKNLIFKEVLISFFIILFTFVCVFLLIGRQALLCPPPAFVMYHAMNNHNWDKVLKEAQKIPNKYATYYFIHAINRALYHKGILLQELFKYPQNQNSLLPFPFSKTSMAFDPFYDFIWTAETWFELGLINIAEHCILEALSRCYYPEGLKLLSKIYLIKNMPEAAQTCLNALKKDFNYKGWVSSFLDSVKADTNFVLTPELNKLCSLYLKQDTILPGNPPLEQLIYENPKNKMAFEYLIAFNLLTRHIDILPKYANMFNTFGYYKMPLVVEEALLLSSSFNENKLSQDFFTPSSLAISSFSKFYSIFISKYSGDPQSSFIEMTDSCGYSYFYYYIYGFTKANLNVR